MPHVLVAASAVVFGLLGVVHIVITFIGNRMYPNDPELIELMKNSVLVIHPSTNTWRGWIGFNASHSLGAILFGCVYGYLSIFEPKILFGSNFLMGVGLLMIFGFFVLAKRYWFSVPLIGISLSLILYVSGVVLSVY